MKSNKVYFQIVEESLDMDKMSCIVRTKPEFPKNAQWDETKVSISPYVMGAFKRGRKNRRMNMGDTWFTKFLSTSDSQEYGDNPFTLIKYVPNKDSDIPVNYRLAFVDEKKGISEEVTDFYDNKFQKWIDLKVKKKDWMRNVVRETTITMEEALKLGVNIVLPK